MTTASLSSPAKRTWSAAGRVRPLLVFYLAGVVLFTAFRVVFLLHNHGSIRHATATELLGCFRVGWFYDTAMLSYFLLPAALVLMLVPRRLYDGARFRAAWAGVAAAVLSAFLLACVSDLFFFDHYADRLNYLVFSYPLFRLDVLDMIFQAYPLGWALALTFLIGAACHMFFGRIAWPRHSGAEPGASRSVTTCLVLGLVLWGCLGPPKRTDSDISPSYISKEHVVNRASLNCMGTLARALFDVFAETNVTPGEYGFGDPAEALATARSLLVQDGDRPTGQPGNPLARVSPPGFGGLGLAPATRPAGRAAPNVVIVVMESMASQYVGSLGGPTPWTPELEALGNRGVMFDRLYAVGTRTSRGLVGVLSGFPDMPGLPTVQNRRVRGSFLTLAEILRGRGYHTMFIHGGNLQFNDVKRYITGHGFGTVVDRASFNDYAEQVRRNRFGPPGQAAFATYWSVDDQSLFLRAGQMLREQPADRPFFATILTLTNHPTYEVPHDVFDYTVRRDHPGLPEEMSEEERAVRYADWAVGDFFRRIEKDAFFANTIFVLVADHCRSQRPEYPVDAANFQIYCSMVGPGELIGPPRRIATVASQADLAPTVLARLGEDSRHCFFGRDIFRVAPDDGFALLQQNGSVGFVRGERLMCILPGRPGPSVKGFKLAGREQAEWDADAEPERSRLSALHRQGLGLFQAAAELFQSGNYHIGGE